MKRVEPDWADSILAGSNLPTDEFTPTEGSTYGMPGFNFDTENNAGVLDGARLPESRGLSGLPDGIVTTAEAFDIDLPEGVAGADEEGPDLGALLAEGGDPLIEETKTAGLVNHDWLDPTRAQDPDRIPDSTYFAAPGEPAGAVGQLAALEEAWGDGKRTDGLRLIPNRDPEIVRYEESLQEPVKSGLPGNSDTEARFLKNAVLRAMRRSVYGEPLRDIQEEVLRTLGAKLAPRVAAGMKIITYEHGLAGKVFIRAAAFPGIRSGKWTKLIKRVAKTARYVIDEPESPVGAMLGMQVVQEIPWKKALAYYSPKLKPLGFKFASTGDPKEILRRAFAYGPGVKAHTPTPKPVVVPPADQVSLAEARQQFAASEMPKLQAPDPRVKREAAARKKALTYVARWVKAGRLTREDALRLAQSQAEPTAILRSASRLVAASEVRQSSYQGVGENALPKHQKLSRSEVWAELRRAEQVAEAAENTRRAVDRKAVLAHVARWASNGFLSRMEVKRLEKMEAHPNEVLKIATSWVDANARKARRDIVQPQSACEAPEYKGPRFERAASESKPIQDLSPEQREIRRIAKQSGIKQSEYERLLKWARVQMTEGVAGNELDALIKARFSKPLLVGASSLLKKVRAQHEGLAGFLYVDSEAYASKTGTAGCEEGGLKHRTNGLKYVLSMNRCASCVNKNAEGVCQKYNKPLVDTAPVKDAALYQKAAIKQANASDAEDTASLFAPTFNPEEFSLTASTDDIDLDESVEVEKLGEVLFGGIEV